MKKRILIIATTMIAVFAVTLGVKGVNSFNTSSLLLSNIEALNLPKESQDNFIIICDKGNDVHCMASCPICDTMWEHPSRLGIGIPTGNCPVCDYYFGE